MWEKLKQIFKPLLFIRYVRSDYMTTWSTAHQASLSFTRCVKLGVQAHSDQWWGRDGRRWEEASSPRWAPRRKLSLYMTPTQVSATPKKAGQRWQEYRFPNDTAEPRSQLALKSCPLLDFSMCEILYHLSHQRLSDSRLRKEETGLSAVTLVP